MRVVFETPALPAKIKGPGGELIDVMTHFEAILYEPGERTNPAGGPSGAGGRPVSDWRAQVGAGMPLQIPPDIESGNVPPAVIPASLLDGLPPSGRLQLLWTSFRKEQSP